MEFQSSDGAGPDFNGLIANQNWDASGDACGLLIPQITPQTLGNPPSAPSRSNSIQLFNRYCRQGSFPKNCTSVFLESWNLDKCVTSPISISFAFDEQGSMTLTRQDGDEVAGPFPPGP